MVSTIGLITDNNVSGNIFRAVSKGESGAIAQTNLIHYVDYLVVGKMSVSYRKGNLVENTIICSVIMHVNIISAENRSIADSFDISANANGITEAQARDEAIHKAINYYANIHSSLK